ncbi:outer membrane protein [Algicella marina]|uniref:Outer membrane beta-barrel protein n=1 Tax=Algicella marina TaxID=2683284 RepID=A0A6P1T2K0_9RHOB|nr:outer membrane beta-barrel protein [Algicella marina]QHQ35975.1 outer membrane beta-barrel protein [Algicella marina]
MRYALGAILMLAAMPATAAEYEINLYTGLQESPHSEVSGTDETGTPFDFTAGWNGNSFEAPPYYGARVTRWQDNNWGFGLEFTHAKVYADDETLADSGFSVLEFTDGINIVTVNASRRFELSERWSAHAGLGLGVSVPHVEVTTPGGAETYEYQLTGPAVRWFAGASYSLTERWSVYGEYGGTYSVNNADLEGGGSLDTNILTNAVNVGVGFSF